MAVKVATKVTLSLRELSKALIAKTTALYANKDNWGRYSYENEIYPQARTAFRDLYPTSLYPTNEEFIERFRKDYYVKGGALQKLIARGDHAQENEIVFNEPGEKEEPVVAGGGESSQSMVGGIPSIPHPSQQRTVVQTQSEPISTAATDKAARLAQENPAITQATSTGKRTEVPKAFETAFENEPEFKLNQQPTPKIPSIQTGKRTEAPRAKEPSPLSNIGTNPGVKYKTGLRNTLKNISSSAGTFFQRNIGKYATGGRLATLATTGIGAVAGFAVSGSPGALFGAAAGFSAPGYLKSRGTQDLRRIGNGVGNIISGATSRASNIRAGINSTKSALSKIARRRKFWIFGSVIFFVLGFALIAGLGGAISPGGGSSTTPGTGITPVTPAIPGGPVTHPIAPTVEASQLRQKIIDQFGVTMDGYDEIRLRYAYEKFTDVSGTNFPKYIRGVTVTNVPKGSQKNNCSSLQIQSFDEELFKLILMHEFGHIIQDCDQGLPRQLGEHETAYNKEGGVTYYANNAEACGSYFNIQEDFAEMIAYYLNPNTSASTACTPSVTNPDIKHNPKFLLHYNVVRTILGDY